MTYTLRYVQTIGFAVLFMVIATLAFAPRAQAATVTTETIREQQRVVLVEIVDVLQSQVKLLQLQFIKQLESQVAVLEAALAAQGK